MAFPIAIDGLADRQEMATTGICLIKVGVFTGFQLLLPLDNRQACRRHVENHGGPQHLPEALAVELVGVNEGFVAKLGDTQAQTRDRTIADAAIPAYRMVPIDFLVLSIGAICA